MNDLEERRMSRNGPQPRRRHRDGRAGLGATLLILFVAAVGYLCVTFVPYYWDFLKMKEITKSVALDWAGLNKRKASQRLEVELRRQDVPDYIDEDHCELTRKADSRVVACAWQADVYYSGTDYYKTLTFSTLVAVDEHGVVLAEEYTPF